MTPEIKYQKLSELTASLQRFISGSFNDSYWLVAELAKVNFYPQSGHCYPDLVEKENGKVKAQMRAIIWADTYRRISLKFRQITNEELKEGLTILFKAQLSFHPIYGLSLNISDIEPSFTLGEMAREKQKTIQKLTQEGILNRNKMLQFPDLPKRIAIISVKTSKGYQDFMSILDNNEWKYKFYHVLFPALLQGDKAVESLSKQLEDIESCKDHFDLLVILRGGGGEVGLSCYDHYKLAKKIALFPLPVLTGIGHSANETVTEMVASKNAITPTAAAYFLIQKFHNISVRLQEIEELLLHDIPSGMMDESKRLRTMADLLLTQTMKILQDEKIGLLALSHKYQSGAMKYLRNEFDRNAANLSAIKYKIPEIVRFHSAKLDFLFKETASTTKRNFLRFEQQLTNLTEKIKLLDPMNVLKRGYSISYYEGKVLKDISGLKKGDILETALYNGKIESKIEKIENDGKEDDLYRRH